MLKGDGNKITCVARRKFGKESFNAFCRIKDERL